ncbi:MAG: hypothetical protein DSY66_04670 [Persephonella sp.]|nr:MAG: hypothetical protein DSY53_04760 [Persephonella sp.]RUM60248.1 MAG: hypothetical protein DSY66_04670 [Persephonella sp.]
MRKFVLVFVSGVVVGTISTFILERKKEKILKKINNLEERLKFLNLRSNLKVEIKNILEKLKISLNNDKNLTEVERDMILKEVKKKIKEIEEFNL